MFRHEFLKSKDIDLLCTYYVFDAGDELRLDKKAVSILRVVLDFNSVMFMFYFNWMHVNNYCILK